MATLDPPFDSLQSGKTHTLQMNFLGWHNVGSCSVSENNQFHFAASGTYSALGHSGSFALTLSLTDQDPASPSGPCMVANAGQTLTGTYSRNGASLVFNADGYTITAAPDPSGVVIQTGGYTVRVLS